MNARRLSLVFRAHHSVALGILLSTLLIFPVLSAAQASDPVAQCTQTFSDCAIPENVQLQFPFLLISGDVVLAPTLQSNLNAVSDVLRLDNNFFDAGAGTGIGFAGALFSGQHALTPISSYSANAVETRENPEGHGDTQ